MSGIWLLAEKGKNYSQRELICSVLSLVMIAWRKYVWNSLEAFPCARGSNSWPSSVSQSSQRFVRTNMLEPALRVDQ